MDQAAIISFLQTSLGGVDTVVDEGNHFFFYDPQKNIPVDHRFPFVTLTTSDKYDQFSNLNRDGVYRLNIGLRKETFKSLFPTEPANVDYSASNQIMPHPVYAKMYWVCILNPSDATFEQVRPLLVEAYEQAKARIDRKG